ncbi:MAG: GGDEF domain-containing protein [Candidatus Wenzhouxiangella sp. M2_3B_020]
MIDSPFRLLTRRLRYSDPAVRHRAESSGEAAGDFRVTITALFLLAAALSVAPFAVYRLFSGDWLLGLVDAAVVIGMLAALAYVWKTRRIRAAGMLAAGFANAMAVLVIVGFGLASDWAYLPLIAGFLIAPRWFGIACTTAVIALVAVWPGTGEPVVDRVTFAAVAVMVSFFSLIFASGVYQRHDELRVAANVDPLTGVGNRRALDEELGLLDDGHRQLGSDALILLDIDHFKRINDRYGHAAGDRVLVDLVEILQRCLRRSDRIFRLGGEEFVVLLSGIASENIETAVRKIMEEIRGGLHGPEEGITVSIGATMVERGEEGNAALARADEAMYRAKRDRDCWVIA